MTTYDIGGRTAEITHPDRVMLPDDGYTTADVAAYHHAVADVLLPTWLTGHSCSSGSPRQRRRRLLPEGGRPRRARLGPHGRGAQGGWHRQPPRRRRRGDGPGPDQPGHGVVPPVVQPVAGPRTPDLLLIDLDPSSDDFDAVRWAALRTREEPDDPGLRPDGWTIETVPRRVTSSGDPWAGMARHARSLSSRWTQLDALVRATGGGS